MNKKNIGQNIENDYLIVEQWINDLSFYKNELSFFRHLIDKYFDQMVTEENMEATQEVVRKIVREDREVVLFTEKLKAQLLKMESFINDSKTYDKQDLVDDLLDFQTEMKMFSETSINLKKEVFTISGHVMEEEKNK